MKVPKLKKMLFKNSFNSQVLKPDFDFRIKLAMIFCFYFSAFVLFLGNIVPFTSALEIKLGFTF